MDTQEQFSTKTCTRSLVIGGGRGIGLALVEQLLKSHATQTVYATYRDSSKADGLLSLQKTCPERLIALRCDPLVENDLKAMTQTIKQTHKHLDLVIVAAGILHAEGRDPEKSLRDIDVAHLQEVFTVNALITPLVAKHVKPLLPRSAPTMLLALSAMVGSIDENEIGGWYGYRASKAALNMMVKTISIEFKRSGFKTQVGAIHPGTTQTALSEKFIGTVRHKVWEPLESAANILGVINGLSPDETGFFKNWDGRTISW